MDNNYQNQGDYPDINESASAQEQAILMEIIRMMVESGEIPAGTGGSAAVTRSGGKEYMIGGEGVTEDHIDLISEALWDQERRRGVNWGLRKQLEESMMKKNQ